MSETTWLVVAHGSRATELAEAHSAVCDELARRVGNSVTVAPAYLELTEPSIPSAIDAAVTAGSIRIVLVPYFLHIGNHTRRDLPAILAESQGRYPDVAMILADHLGLDPRLVDIVADRARHAESRAEGESR